MKAIGTVLYEIEDMQELNSLPQGQMVLRYDRQFGCHRMLEVGKDKFSADTNRYSYLLLEAPKLPKVVLT